VNLHGFELVEERTIKEINSQAKLYRHIRTGAELLSLENSDENKCFGVNFKTPPNDSTGLPHILEHSVLGGSRKYPVKEPFVELLKGSLKTFLNAFTFPDMTCYPVASQNLQDFYNLIDVYLDAVFYPRITEETLQQEGWHYEVENPDAPLTYKGIVYNEMKGVFSSPDQLIGMYTEEALFPDTIYSNNSGGDPAVIPDLTYEQFKKFHETYYHPSNARFFFYGDDDPEERLRLIDAFIVDFNRIDVDGNIPLQLAFDAPRVVTKGYDAGEDGDNKSMVTVSWLLDETTDVQMALELSILTHILTGTPASPLRKALLDSGLGEDLVGAGLSPYQRQMYFSTGLKGVAAEDTPKVEPLILNTLSQLAEQGIDKETVEASMNTVEFQMRELNTGQFPRGLALMVGMLPTWIHGGDPLAALEFEGPLQTLKDRLAQGEPYFEGLIGKLFLDNPSRSTLILQPDATEKEKREAAERERLEKARASMTDADIQQVIETARKLRELQEAPNSPEALATIPSLTLNDLDKQIKTFPLEVIEEAGGKILYHDLPTNGVAYLDVGFNLTQLPAEYLPYVPLFGRALLELGTQTEDFVKLSQRIGRETGGIHPQEFTATVRGGGTAAWQLLRGKAMASQTSKLVDILRDILLTVKFDNPERFRQMVLEEKAGAESSINFSGHAVANSRLRSHFTEADWASEQMGGVSHLFFLRKLAEQVENDWPSVLNTLQTIWQLLVKRGSMLFNVTLDAENWSRFRSELSGLIASLPGGAGEKSAWAWQTAPKSEGLTIPSQVNYVVKGANLYDLGYQLHGSNRVILQFMNTTYMWDKIRAQGGAYGGFVNFDYLSGNFSFMSYRDPNLGGTLDNYDAASDFLMGLDLDADEVTKSIIGAVGQMDAYLLPDAKGYTSMLHHLTGITNDERQRLRDEVLATTAQDFRRFGESLKAVNEKGLVVVVGSKDNIAAVNAERGNLLEVVNVL
jgi:Zn-dependent M16 (insulinase) family peptidase